MVNPFKTNERDYYKTHACPKGSLILENNLTISQKTKHHAISLPRFLLRNVKKGDFVTLILHIATAIKITSGTLRGKSRGELESLGFENYPKWRRSRHCEATLCRVFNNEIKKSGSACIIGCKLYENPLKVCPSQRGNYVVVVSAIDGPKGQGLAATGCLSSIFGIYPIAQGRKLKEQVLQKGINLLCAGYSVYGTSTMLYIALRGRGTHGFMLQTNNGEFILTEPNVKVPGSGPLYSLNEGRCVFYEDWFLDWLNCLKNPSDGAKLVALTRNTNSKVADIHQILKWGGLYIRPNCEMSDIDDPHYLVYEMIPLGFVLEEAGGLGTTGRHLLLDVEPKELHEMSQVFIGSRINVLLLLTEINPSLLVKARIYTLDPKECQGGRITYKRAQRNIKEKRNNRFNKIRNRSR